MQRYKELCIKKNKNKKKEEKSLRTRHQQLEYANIYWYIVAMARKAVE